MTIGAGGYGRYEDDADRVGCPRAATDWAPCIARDGRAALNDDRVCVGCGEAPRPLLGELRRVLKRAAPLSRNSPAETADRLRDLVRDVTEPATFLEAP